MKTAQIRIAVAVLAMTGVGCTTITDAVLGGAEQAVGRTLTDRVEQSLYERLAPSADELASTGDLPGPDTVMWANFMVSQAQIMFAIGFTATGYQLEDNSYSAGEYAVFRIEDTDMEAEELLIERALLGTDGAGNQWWRLSWSDDEETWAYEGLLDPEQQLLVELWAADPEGSVQQIAVSEDFTVTMPSQSLPDEAMRDASRSQESVETPAGTFEAEALRLSDPESDAEAVWWLVPTVPGGLVRYRADEPNGTFWSSTLVEFGAGATSEFGVF